jgi:hypothetical protein
MINKYVTVTDDDDAIGYRDISRIMTDAGHKMNHSSVRNYVLRAMRKFAFAIAQKEGITLTDERAWEVAKNPMFQRTIRDFIEYESMRE